MKMREDERDELLSPRPGEGLPCDLPDEDRRGGFASLAAALGPRTRGRALVAGIASINLLRYISSKGKFGGFAYYCWVIGVLSIILTMIF